MNGITVVRDVAIILLAVESIVVGIILSILLIQIRNMIILMREELQPVISSTQETTETVRATTQFVSKRVVKPGVDIMSTIAGIRQGFRTLRDGVLPRRGGASGSSPSSANIATTTATQAGSAMEVAHE